MRNRSASKLALFVVAVAWGCSRGGGNIGSTPSQSDGSSASGSALGSPMMAQGGAASSMSDDPVAGTSAEATGGSPSVAGGTSASAGATVVAESGGGTSVVGAGGSAGAESPSRGTPDASTIILGPEGSGSRSEFYGYWLAWGAIGDCIDLQRYLAFHTDSQMQQITDDRDACVPVEEWSTVYEDGTYSFEDRTLSYRLYTGERRSFGAVVGTIGTSRVLFHSIFLPLSDRVWRADTLLETATEDGMVDYRREVTAEISFDGAIPHSGEGTCAATIDFSVDVFDVDASDGITQRDYPGSVADVPCAFAEVERGQEISFQGLTFGDHPSYVASVLLELFSAAGPRLWLPREDEFLYGNYYVGEEGVPARLE